MTQWIPARRDNETNRWPFVRRAPSILSTFSMAGYKNSTCQCMRANTLVVGAIMIVYSENKINNIPFECELIKETDVLRLEFHNCQNHLKVLSVFYTLNISIWNHKGLMTHIYLKYHHQIRACRLLSDNPLFELMKTYPMLDPTRKCRWKCRLLHGSHLVHTQCVNRGVPEPPKDRAEDGNESADPD